MSRWDAAAWSGAASPVSSRSSRARAGKAALWSETGAAAVDMESHIAAAYAAANRGLPFAALRVISDPANRALPAIAMSAIKPNGDIDLRKVLRGVARNPMSLRALVSTGIDFNRALRSLRGCRSFLLGDEGAVIAVARTEGQRRNLNNQVQHVKNRAR